MRYTWLDEYLCAKKGVTKDLQPSWNWIRYHVGGKMFCAVCLDDHDQPYYINLKLEPAEGEFWRGRYEDVLPGHYSNKQHWNSVRPDGAVPDDVLRDMLDKSYALVLAGLSKKKQQEILNDQAPAGCCRKETRMVERISDTDLKKTIAGKILENLHDWFEVDESRERYIRECAGWMFFAAREKSDYVGFLCLKETGRQTVELAVMGVLREYHRNGLGRALFMEAQRAAAKEGYSFMQVKTVKMGVYEDYDVTNRFYLSMGFAEFEVMEELWGKENPCQIYVMSLK